MGYDLGDGGRLEPGLDAELAPDASGLDAELAPDASGLDAFLAPDAQGLDAFLASDAPGLDAFFALDAARADVFFALDAARPDASFALDARGPDATLPGCPADPYMEWLADGDATDEQRRLDLAVTGTVSYVPGRRGQAWSFTGAGFLEGAHVAAGPLSALDAELSVEAWVNVDAAPMTGRIVDRITPGMHDGFLLDVNTFQPRWITSTGIIGAATLPAGRWVHLLGTLGPSGTRLYVDGALVASSPASAVGDNMNDLRIGADQVGTSQLVGRVDDVRIYCRELSGAEVAALAAALPP